MYLSFDRIRLRSGESYPISAEIEGSVWLVLCEDAEFKSGFFVKANCAGLGACFQMRAEAVGLRLDIHQQAFVVGS